MKEKFEYVKWYAKIAKDGTVDIFFYEVDLENERYATRMVWVHPDRNAEAIIEPGFEFITEEPIPEISEINIEDEYFAEIISKEEFEDVYQCNEYLGNMEFPKSNAFPT